MFEVMVPYTTANLGPGFDCVGLAFTAEARIAVAWCENGHQWNNCDPQYQNDEHLLLRSYRLGLQEASVEEKCLDLDFLSMPPIARGLGSSAVCVVAGLLIAREVAREAGKDLTNDQLIRLATVMEGHPDNIAPAILGGCVVSLMTETEIVSQQLQVHDKIGLMALIPPFELSTEISRNALPDQVPHKQAIFNVGRAMLLTQALATGEMDKLAIGLQDQLHEPYRIPLIHGAETIKDQMEVMGAVRTVISGAGPTLLVVYDRESDFEAKAIDWMKDENPDWQVYPWQVSKQGARVKK